MVLLVRSYQTSHHGGERENIDEVLGVIAYDRSSLDGSSPLVSTVEGVERRQLSGPVRAYARLTGCRADICIESGRFHPGLFPVSA